VRTGKPYEAARRRARGAGRERGAFVTITKKRTASRLHRLRGRPIKPLYITVRDVARMAALNDGRFSPVAVSELGSLQYEISVLSPYGG